MNLLPGAPVLHGSLVRLEPLSMSHGEDLAVSVEDRSAYGFTHVPRAWEVKEYLAAHFERARGGKLAPFAQIRHSDGRAVGVTVYWDPGSGRAALRCMPSCVPLRSAGPGWPLRLSERASMSRQRSCCLSMRSRPWAWAGSTSRPARATSSPGALSSAWGRSSRAFVATGRSLTRLRRTVSSATPRCSRSSPPSGRPQKPPCAVAWPGRPIAKLPCGPLPQLTRQGSGWAGKRHAGIAGEARTCAGAVLPTSRRHRPR